MSTTSLDDEIQVMLEQADDDQSALISQLDTRVEQFGLQSVQDWRNVRNKARNTLVHEFVERNWTDVVRHAVGRYRLNVHIHRELDGKSPIQLAQFDGSEEMSNLFEELESNPEAEGSKKQDESNDDDDGIDPKNRKKLNMVWLDLEMTSLENPKIMECAVIITDKYLNELARGTLLFFFDLIIQYETLAESFA